MRGGGGGGGGEGVLRICDHMVHVALLVHSRACTLKTIIPHGSPHYTALHSVVIGFVVASPASSVYFRCSIGL